MMDDCKQVEGLFAIDLGNFDRGDGIRIEHVPEDDAVYVTERYETHVQTGPWKIPVAEFLAMLGIRGVAT